MAPPNWLPPLNSHNEYSVSVVFSPGSPRYDRIISHSYVFLMKTIVSVKFKSADEHSKQKTFEGLRFAEEFGFRCCSVNSLSSFSSKTKNYLFPWLYIPFDLDKDLLVKEISKFAKNMRRKTYKCYTILPFKLEIVKEITIPERELESWNSWYDQKVLADPDFDNDYRKAISRPRTHEELLYETTQLAFKSAGESSIEQLKMVIIDDSSSSKKSCAICLEELNLGSKATRMPCSHIFHGDCVVQWLEVSHMCPLCRFELPFV